MSIAVPKVGGSFSSAYVYDAVSCWWFCASGWIMTRLLV